MNESPPPFARRGVVLLVDPDRVTATDVADAIRIAAVSGFKAAWIGGTFLHRGNCGVVVQAAIRAGQASGLPIFAILGLSSAESVLASGLSGVLLPLVGTLSAAGELVRQAYRATPALTALGAPVIPIAYLAVDGGQITSSTHGLQGVPLPRDKPEIAATLALCAQFIGVKAVYLDAGSGASNIVPANLIEAVCKAISCPLIVGGGIRRPEQAETAFAAGADVVVIGSVFEATASSSLYESFGAVIP
jgi:geranylgeranylglyceryl phosphate synthase family protein